jgi:hypothetical protein
MDSAMIIKGIIIQGKSIKDKIMLLNLGIDRYLKESFIFLMILKDLDTLQTFAQ